MILYYGLLGIGLVLVKEMFRISLTNTKPIPSYVLLYEQTSKTGVIIFLKADGKAHFSQLSHLKRGKRMD